MNLSKFLVLGTLDILAEGSGYDIISKLEELQVDRWTNFKQGSIYFAIKQLSKDNMIEELRREQESAFPVKIIYKITTRGQKLFDTMQEEAFNGLFPYFYGFKLGLKFNHRRSNEEIVHFAKLAIEKVDNIISTMEQYIKQHEETEQYNYDEFFIQHDLYLFNQEKFWLKEVIEKYK